jgi:hypothetical protein
MTESIVRKQLHRQFVLQERVIMPPGRTLSKEEGRMLAKAMMEESEQLAGKGSSSDDPLLNSAVGDTVVLENQISKKIVTMNQKQNKAENVEAAVAAMRAERLPAEGKQATAAVRQAAARLFDKDKGAEHAMIRKQRAKRAERVPVKKDK